MLSRCEWVGVKKFRVEFVLESYDVLCSDRVWAQKARSHAPWSRRTNPTYVRPYQCGLDNWIVRVKSNSPFSKVRQPSTILWPLTQRKRHENGESLSYLFTDTFKKGNSHSPLTLNCIDEEPYSKENGKIGFLHDNFHPEPSAAKSGKNTKLASTDDRSEKNESTHRENKDLYMIYALGAVEVVPLAQNLWQSTFFVAPSVLGQCWVPLALGAVAAMVASQHTETQQSILWIL